MCLKLLYNKALYTSIRPYATTNCEKQTSQINFETVFSFPFIKYFALFNRLKVYHVAATSVAIPGSGILEALNVIPDQGTFTTCYVGLTGAALLSIASIPFRNIIGFLYVSEDNKHIKISAVNYWGKRQDEVVPVDDWVPLHELPSKTTDAIYLTPQLTNGVKYKLLLKFGSVLNSSKMGQVLE